MLTNTPSYVLQNSVGAKLHWFLMATSTFRLGRRPTRVLYNSATYIISIHEMLRKQNIQMLFACCLTAWSAFGRRSRHQKDRVWWPPAVCWDVARCSVSAKTPAADWWTGSSNCTPSASQILHNSLSLQARAHVQPFYSHYTCWPVYYSQQPSQ